MNDNGNKILYKVLMFIIIMGVLIFIGFNQMNKNKIDKNKVSVNDVKDIFNEKVIGEVDFIEIQTEMNDENGLGYSAPVSVSDRNSIYYLRNELNNCERMDENEVLNGGSYEGSPIVTFYMNDETVLYSAISKDEDGKTIFYVAKNVDLGDKINYKLLVEDDIEEYVINLYNQNKTKVNDQSANQIDNQNKTQN